MNKTLAIVGAIIIVAILGGALYYASQNNTVTTTPATTEQTTQTTNTQNQITGQVVTATTPTVTTNTNVSPTDTTAIVSGSITPEGALTSYWYEYGTTASLGNKTTTQTIGSGFTSIPAPGYIVGLAKSTTYYFRLVGQNQFGTVAGTTYSFQTTSGNPPPVGSAPTTHTVAASGVSATTANLNGTVNPNKSSTQYWFEYGVTPNLGNTSAFSSIGDGSASLTASMSLSNLDPQTTYYFRLDAQNQFGTITGSILNFKTKAAPATSTTNINVNL